MSHRVTIICDGCDKNWMVDETMDLPPYWIYIRSVIADKDGQVPPHEQEDSMDLHFCSRECAADYLMSDEFRARSTTVDRQFPEDSEAPDES